MYICKLFDETLIHLFYECEIIQNFWQSVIDWVKTKYPHTLNFNSTAQNIIFGITENTKSNNILNLIILITKKYIYNARYKDQVPNIQALKQILKFHYKSEKYSSYANCEWEKFNTRWSQFDALIKEDQ